MRRHSTTISGKSNLTDLNKDVRVPNRTRKGSLNILHAVHPSRLADVFRNSKSSLTDKNKMEVSTIELQSHDNENFKKIKESEHFLSSFGEKGGKPGEFQDAKCVTVMPEDRLMITDFINSRIQTCDKSGKCLLAYSGDDVIQPWCSVLTNEQSVMFTSCKERCVVLLKLDGSKLSDFGKQMFLCPSGLAIDSQDRIIVTDSMSNRVSMHEPDGTLIRYLGDIDDDKQRLSRPQYVCVSTNSDILVADSGNHSIKIYSSDGNFVKSFGSFGKETGKFKSPHGICTNKAGEIFVADHYNNRISVYNRNGIFLHHIVTSEDGLVHPQGIAMDTDGHLYVTHGHLKASEILTFKLTHSQSMRYYNVITNV